MKRISVILLLCTAYNVTQAQTHKTKKVVKVIPDSVHRQEVAAGADSTLIINTKYTRDTTKPKNKYPSYSVDGKRKKLSTFSNLEQEDIETIQGIVLAKSVW